MQNILTPPDNITKTESRTSIYWIDEDGIMCSVSKRASMVKIDETLQILADFKEYAQGKKFCMLLDVTNANPSDKASRELAAKEFPQFVKAMAILSASPLGRMLTKISLALMTIKYPVKMFATEKDAKLWLKQYL